MQNSLKYFIPVIPMDRTPLILSTFCFLLGFAYTMFALGRGRYHPSKWNFLVMLAGFLLQTAFLYERGQALGRCPLTNLFDVLLFLSWSMVLIYLLIGSTYRLSLLGVFTSPMVFIFQMFSLVAPVEAIRPVLTPINPLISIHAAISVVAYGAFALACVAGGMYLVQERQIKTRHLRSFFYDLPPIGDLAVVIGRLLFLGFGLLTIGLVAVVAGEKKPPAFGNILQLVRAFWPAAVWFFYALILAAKALRQLPPRRLAMASIVAFLLAMSIFWGLNFISDKGHF